ncbi:MAG: hypothetical protein HYZ35_06680, partial [Chloroflexi bacterium]|nr:hypothetical protein [Chloroflexota bacterium]
MNEHLTDAQLNEFLDGLADASTRRHARTCTECRARLENLRVVFKALESLPDARLPQDLTASILARLPNRRLSAAWTWVFAAQLIGTLIIAASLASSFELPSSILAYQPPTFEALLASLFTFLSSFSFELPTFDFQFSTVNLQLSTFNFQ